VRKNTQDEGDYNAVTEAARKSLASWALVGYLLLGGVATSAFAEQSLALREKAAINRGTLFRHGSEVPKTHGAYLDEKHRVTVIEDDGWAVIVLQKKERAPGGPFDYYTTMQEDGRDTVIRFDDEYELIRIGSEVLAPAPPNYVRNPGRRYRIIFEGLAVAPDYKSQIEADASDALDAIGAVLRQLANMGKGMEGPAIEFGGLLAMRAFNESGFLPARIPLTVLRSKVGQVRIQGQYYDRGGKILRLPRFGDVEQEQRFNYVIPSLKNPLKPDPKRVQGPAYRRGKPEDPSEPQLVASRHFRPEKALVPRDVRANQLRGIREPEGERDRLGVRGRAVTDKGAYVAPVTDAALSSIVLLRGELRNPLEARADLAYQAGYQSSVGASNGKRSGTQRAGGLSK